MIVGANRLRMTSILLGAVAIAISAANHAQTLPCFEEFHQVYEYNDEARLWLQVMQPSCRSRPLPGDPGSAGLSGGRIEVRRSGSDVYFHEHKYTWIIEHRPPQMCIRAREVHTRTTKVLIGGEYYELTERDGEAPRRKQERRRTTINIPHTTEPPRDVTRALFTDLGIATIAGHTCQRYRADLGPNASGEFCVIRLPSQCPTAQSLMMLEQIGPIGNPIAETRGRTIFLRTGRRGEVLSRGTIAPP